MVVNFALGEIDVHRTFHIDMIVFSDQEKLPSVSPMDYLVYVKVKDESGLRENIKA